MSTKGKTKLFLFLYALLGLAMAVTGRSIGHVHFWPYILIFVGGVIWGIAYIQLVNLSQT